MKDHYNFSDATYNELLKKGITVVDLFKSIPLFDPHKSGAELGNQTALFYFMDVKGSIDTKPITKEKKIAQAIFESLEIKEKIAVAEYGELTDNDFEEEDEDE